MAKIDSISASVGMSYEKNGVWIKPYVSIKVNLVEGDTVDTVMKRAFEVVEEEISKEIDRLEAGEDNIDSDKVAPPTN